MNALNTSTRPAAALPEQVLEVFNHFFTTELTTLGKDGTPVTWPVLPIYWPERLAFVIFTPAGLSQKAANIRREPRVSMLFSEPIGSGLDQPAAVLVQGLAEAPDELNTSVGSLEPELWAAMKAQTYRLIRRQPALKLYMLNPVTRFVMDWYFMRLVITVRPQRILWWAEGDFSQPPRMLEVDHVD